MVSCYDKIAEYTSCVRAQNMKQHYQYVDVVGPNDIRIRRSNAFGVLPKIRIYPSTIQRSGKQYRYNNVLVQYPKSRMFVKDINEACHSFSGIILDIVGELLNLDLYVDGPVDVKYV